MTPAERAHPRTTSGSARPTSSARAASRWSMRSAPTASCACRSGRKPDAHRPRPAAGVPRRDRRAPALRHAGDRGDRPGEAYTDRAAPAGRPMVGAAARRLGDDARDKAFRNYVAAIDAFGTIALPDRPYGQSLATSPVTRRRLARRIARAEPRPVPRRATALTIAARGRRSLSPVRQGGRHDRRPARACRRRRSSTATIFPATCSSTTILSVAGGARLRRLHGRRRSAARPRRRLSDARTDRRMHGRTTRASCATWCIERHGEEIAPALRFYRAYLAFSMADPANAAPPYPRLYGWSIAMLKLLAEDRLPSRLCRRTRPGRSRSSCRRTRR